MLKVKLFRLIGSGLFVLGVLLCLYPYLINMVSKENKKMNLLDSELIGTLGIPKINVNLPIYESTKTEILEVGVGHLSETSLPGNKGTHCVLAGHRGLPNADLFIRLGEMTVGDIFYITIQGQAMSYKVCKIQVIKPEEISKLFARDDGEFVSLVTCTPYGLNTHRLVVTGERMEGEE